MANSDGVSVGRGTGLSSEIQDNTVEPGLKAQGVTVRQFRTVEDLRTGLPFLGAGYTLSDFFRVAHEKGMAAAGTKAIDGVPRFLLPIAWVAKDGVDPRKGIVGRLEEALPFEIGYTALGIVRYIRSLKGEAAGEEAEA